jgi:hypothetical protein
MAWPLIPGVSAVDPVVAAFRGQRPAIKRLLDEAGVPLEDVDAVLLEAFQVLALWLEPHREEIVLLQSIDAACSRYAAEHGRPYRGLGTPPRK